MKKLLVLAALALATPAAAQYSENLGPQPRLVMPETRNNVARANLGVGLYNSGWYNCYYYYPYANCTSGSYTSWVPFVAGAQVDLGLSGQSALSLGVSANMGTVNSTVYSGVTSFTASKNVTVWEPTVDYVGRTGPAALDTRGRFRAGAGAMFGPNGGWGAVLRLGGGVSLLNTHRVGVGLDFVFEGGSYQGYWIGGLQLLVSPEFHF